LNKPSNPNSPDNPRNPAPLSAAPVRRAPPPLKGQGKTAAEKAREQRLHDAEIARQQRLKEAEVAKQARIRKAKEEKQRQLDLANQAAAEALPDPKALDIARQKLIHGRKKSRLAALFRFLFMVVVPTILIGFYLYFIATPLYKTQASFSVHTSKSSGGNGLAGLIGGSGFDSGMSDAFMAREYILSRSMMKEMERKHQFVSRFKSDELDPFTRSHNSELFGIDDYSNYLRHVTVSIDVQEGLLRLYVYARTPQESVEISKSMLAAAEKKVNILSNRMFNDQVSLMTLASNKAENELQETRRKIIDLQIRHGELAPRETVLAIYKSIQSLEEKIKAAERQRDVQLRGNVSNSPAILRLNTEISVMQSQLASQRARLVGQANTKSLNSILAKFEYATIQSEISKKRWEVTLETLQRSRQDALLQRRYLTVIAPPIMPVFPDNESRVSTMLFTFFALTTLFLIWSVFSSAVRVRTRVA
jgi:capsular polysaccharide transport system permease protein